MFDQYGNYIPDSYGGQPVTPVTPDMQAMMAMNPQMMQRGQAMQQAQQAQNTAPVLAPQRQSIQPMGMQQSGPMPVADIPASSLASALREGAFDKEGNPVSIEDRMKNKWDKGIKKWENFGQTLDKIGNRFGSLFGD